MPSSKVPVRTALSPNIKEPYTQPRSTAVSMVSEMLLMEVAPRGSRSSAVVMSLASTDASSP